MQFTTSVKHTLNNYANFRGRAVRAEFWYFWLFNFLTGFLLSLVGGLTETSAFFVMHAIFILLMLVPSVAVLVRRIHDCGHSGWWILSAFIPLIGAFALLYFAFRPGDESMNAYGPVPVYQDTSVTVL